MKKTIILILCCSFLILILASCNVSDKSDEINTIFDQEECEEAGKYFWNSDCHSFAICDTQYITPCIDMDTSYIWSTILSSEKNWDDAIAYCDNLTEGEYYDWTLPSKDVLLSLYNEEKHSSKLGDTGNFWSSTTRDNEFAWSISFTDGDIQANMKSYLASVRCVRTAN